MSVPVTDERVQLLSRQIANMYLGTASLDRLGSVALDILVAKETADEVVRGDFPEKEKREARKRLKDLKKMEKNIVRLYFMTKFGKERQKKTPFLDYIMSRYSSP